MRVFEHAHMCAHAMKQVGRGSDLVRKHIKEKHGQHLDIDHGN